MNIAQPETSTERGSGTPLGDFQDTHFRLHRGALAITEDQEGVLSDPTLYLNPTQSLGFSYEVVDGTLLVEEDGRLQRVRRGIGSAASSLRQRAEAFHQELFPLEEDSGALATGDTDNAPVSPRVQLVLPSGYHTRDHSIEGGRGSIQASDFSANLLEVASAAQLVNIEGVNVQYLSVNAEPPENGIGVMIGNSKIGSGGLTARVHSGELWIKDTDTGQLNTRATGGANTDITRVTIDEAQTQQRQALLDVLEPSRWPSSSEEWDYTSDTWSVVNPVILADAGATIIRGLTMLNEGVIEIHRGTGKLDLRDSVAREWHMYGSSGAHPSYDGIDMSSIVTKGESPPGYY